MATAGKTYKPYTHVAESNADLVKKVMGRNLNANQNDLLAFIEAVGYYRLKGYLVPFYQPGTEVFKAGVNFADIQTVYKFDRYLREMTMNAIARLEVGMRARIIKVICESYSNPSEYHKPHVFPKLTVLEHAQLLERIAKSVHQSKNEPFLRYARHVYGFEDLPPIWTMMEVVSFGTMMDIFKGLSEADQQKVADEFHVRPAVLHSWFALIQRVRNVCAHHGRLWNRHLQNPLSVTPGSQPQLAPLIACLKAQTLQSCTTVFSALSVILYCLQIVRPQSGWKGRCKSMLAGTTQFVRNGMGVPANWQNLSLWK